MKRGRFIVFEGIDGCGKGTQFSMLANYLYKLNKYNHIIMTREPWKDREIRKILSKDEPAEQQAEKLAELFVKDRKEHVSELIIPSLRKGIDVISDRYALSTICYQQAQGMSLEKLKGMHAGVLVPDVIFILDLPAEAARKRMKKDVRGREQKFEKSVEFQEKVRQNFLKTPRTMGGNIIVINGNQKPDEVHAEVIRAFNDIFPEKG
jgi:dTMP kinase